MAKLVRSIRRRSLLWAMLKFSEAGTFLYGGEVVGRQVDRVKRLRPAFTRSFCSSTRMSISTSFGRLLQMSISLRARYGDLAGFGGIFQYHATNQPRLRVGAGHDSCWPSTTSRDAGEPAMSGGVPRRWRPVAAVSTGLRVEW